MVFVVYTQRGNQLLYYNLLCLLLYPFWGLETTLCHRTHWSPDFLWIRVAPVWFYSKFIVIWIKGLNIRYTLILHSNANLYLWPLKRVQVFLGETILHLSFIFGVNSSESQGHKRLCKSVNYIPFSKKGPYVLRMAIIFHISLNQSKFPSFPANIVAPSINLMSNFWSLLKLQFW